MKKLTTAIGIILIAGNAYAVACNPGYYLDNTGNNCIICPAGSTCAGGDAAPVTCAYGTYTGDVYGNNATGATVCNACPEPADHMIPEYPTSWYVTMADGTIDPTIRVTISGFQQWGAIGDVTTCRITYGIVNKAGIASDQSWKFNVSTQKYDTDADNRPVYYSSKINPGYYVQGRYLDTYCNTETNPQLYSYAHQCPIGSYCPGVSVPKCSDTSHVYTENDTLGITACFAGGTTESAGSTSLLDCYADPNTSFTDEKGTYHYTERCYYE